MPLDLFALVLTSSAAALPVAAEKPAQTGSQSVLEEQTNEISRQFSPRQSTEPTRLDYSHWDEALRYFVFYMGPSENRIMPKVSPTLGTRLVYGHDSGLRLEGNRVGFSFLEDEQREALTEYRQDLESLGSQIRIASLPRNEQLAYWLNLHNVAVIEQIALAYPVARPSQIRVGADQLPLDEAKFLNVNGVALSLNDIRTRIVYPNWNDPRVIYGFFRGEIGGPTIQRNAFNSENVGALLQMSATEFINSMRGVEKRGSTLHISQLYEEAMPFYFDQDEGAFRTHIAKFASKELQERIIATDSVRPTIYEYAISDLANGDRGREYYTIGNNPDKLGYGYDTVVPGPIGVPDHVVRLAEEKVEKLDRMRKSGELRGLVVLLDPESEEANQAGSEVE